MNEVKSTKYICKNCGFETDIKPQGYPECPLCNDKKKTFEDRKKSIKYEKEVK